ncbi:MAG: hypothetical protein P1U56_05620 [Saprospiraceae bacterium]|nr:hypothetical protein [Saprospiraceae bacterium]
MVHIKNSSSHPFPNLIILLIIVLNSIGCSHQSSKDKFSLKDSTWMNQNGNSEFKIDSSYQFTVRNKYGIMGQYDLHQITEDSFVFESTYKDSLVPGGFVKVLDQNQLFYCSYKTHPNRSGLVDYSIVYYRDTSSINLEPANTRIVFPRKKGRYVLEFTQDGFSFDPPKPKVYQFKETHLRVKEAINPLQFQSQNLRYQFEDNKHPLPMFSSSIDIDTIVQINPDSLFLFRFGLNAFSHYKIYEYDSIVVQKEALYYYLGSIQEIRDHDFYGSH